jgi:hypothetical protein
MSKVFARLRRVVWAAVLAVLFCFVSFWAAVTGHDQIVLASGLTSATFALLSLRAST